MRKGGVLAATAMLLCASMPAQAAMGCWDGAHVAAAKIRDLQSRLMVATLRCQAAGMDVSPTYNRFVRANRETIQTANAALLAQFRSGYGSQAETQYDRFATALANIYGADATDSNVCSDTAALAEESAAANGNLDALVTIEDRLGFTATLPGGRCGDSYASLVTG